MTNREKVSDLVHRHGISQSWARKIVAAGLYYGYQPEGAGRRGNPIIQRLQRERGISRQRASKLMQDGLSLVPRRPPGRPKKTLQKNC